jgi:holo-[acyl-carrier protein] synthase
MTGGPLQITSGIDAIEIERIATAIERWGERFLLRIYTPTEIEHCRGRAQSLAGRFAAKEAASKALGVGIRGLSWRDIEVVRGPRGKPVMQLHGKAARIAAAQGLTSFEVSITHSRTDAMAVVIAWSAGG